MEMSSPEAIIRANEPVRPLKRIEYERLAAEGFFDEEHVELLFGMVVPMTPTDAAHSESAYRVRRILEKRLGLRACVRNQDPFAASDISEPEPDVMVVPNGDYWNAHPTRAFLIVEVARSSLGKDQGPKSVLYGLAAVDEYWIVNHVDGVVEVFRDPQGGEWRSRSTHGRGEVIAMTTFADVEIAVSEILPPMRPAV